MTVPDPLKFDEVAAWVMTQRDPQEAAVTALARFIREDGDLHRLLGLLTQTASRQMLRAIQDLEDDRPPVVRPIRRNAAPNAAMVNALADLERNMP